MWAAVHQLDLGLAIEGLAIEGLAIKSLAIGLRRSIPQDSHLSLQIGRRMGRFRRFRALALNLPFP
jgi:hypothetical protein